MDILFILGFANPFPGAAWTRIGFFVKALSKRGHDITVLGTFTPTTLKKMGSSKLANDKISNLIFYIGLKHPTIFIINSIISFIVSIFYLVAKKPDIAIISLPTGDVGLGAILSCKATGTSYVIDYRDEWENYMANSSDSKNQKSFYQIISKLMTILYSSARLTITVTPSFMSQLKHRGVTNLKLIPNGADVNIFFPQNKVEIKKKLKLGLNDFIFVYNGLIGGYYDLRPFIKAFAKLPDISGVKLIIIGQGTELLNILKLSKDLHLQDSILYLGVIRDQKHVAEILAASDIGIIPGIYSKGQLAVKFFEYCACGIPVLASAPSDSAISKLINDNKVGLTISSMDEKKIAECMYQLFSDKLFRESAGRKARSLVEDLFDRNKIADSLIKIIEASS